MNWGGGRGGLGKRGGGVFIDMHGRNRVIIGPSRPYSRAGTERAAWEPHGLGHVCLGFDLYCTQILHTVS